MKKDLQILQIGTSNWSSQVIDGLKWTYVNCLDEVDEQWEKLSINENKEATKTNKVKPFDAVVISQLHSNFNFSILQEYIEPYTILINEQLSSDVISNYPFLKHMSSHFINMQDVDEVMQLLKRNFFIGQNGTKLHVKNAVINYRDDFKVHYNGNNYVEISQMDQTEYKQLLYWTYNIGLGSESYTDLWLEYQADNLVEIRMILYFIDSMGKITTKQFSQAEMDEKITIGVEEFTYLSISIEAAGKGSIKIGPMHYRQSREEFGEMLLGGKVAKDSNRQEFFYYFYPGDLKPPLNVYFSGYRTAEGFEGYWMMKNLGKPFLLIGDPRLEGGNFYVGSNEYEQNIENTIRYYLDLLDLTNEQLTVSGLSMGTYGALYYGARLGAPAIIVGKPLISIGNIAKNLPIHRPEAFETSLDMVNSFIELGGSRYEYLNNKIIPYLKKAKFPGNTTIAIAYMLHDDYDDTAYFNLLDHLSEKDVNIISKGLVGRHNDNSPGINQWFYTQLKRLTQTLT